MLLYPATAQMALAVMFSLALAQPVVRTWGSLVEQDPAVKSLMLYCDVTSTSQSDCAGKFLGIDAVTGGSTVVARQAAATCLERQSLANTALMNMFNVDAKRMSQYANGPILGKPPKNTHWGWSNAAKDEAAKKGFETSAKESALTRKLQHSADHWDKIFPEEHGNAGNIIIVTETLLDFGMAISAGSDARNDPWSVGVPPDQVIPDQQPPGAGPPATGPPGHDPDDINENPGGMPITSDSVFESDVVDVDLSDDITATPILQDETTRTALQKCQESEEAKLWKQVGSIEIDPNADMMGSDKENAERLKAYGVCDREYYGEKACAEWKETIDVTPLSPEAQASRDEYIAANPLCPVNLVSESDCHKAQQEMFKHYAIPEVDAVTVNSLFKPGKPIPWMPRTDLGLSQVRGDLKPVLPSFKTRKDEPGLFSPDGAFIPPRPRPGTRPPVILWPTRDEL